jgi:hypothetical protein
VDGVLDARPLQSAIDGDGTRAQGKELTRQPQGLPHGGGGIERAIIGGPVGLHPSRHHQSRELLVGGELEERIVLVVAQDDVVAGPVLADEVRLQHEGLELVVGHEVLEVTDLPDQ